MSNNEDNNEIEGSETIPEQEVTVSEDVEDQESDVITAEDDLFDMHEDATQEVYEGYKKKGRSKIFKSSAITLGVLAAIGVAYYAGKAFIDKPTVAENKGGARVLGSNVGVSTSVADKVSVSSDSRISEATVEADKERLKKARESEGSDSAIKAIQGVNDTGYVLVDNDSAIDDTRIVEPPKETADTPSLRELTPELRAEQLGRLFKPLNGTPLPFSDTVQGDGFNLILKASEVEISRDFNFEDYSSTEESETGYELASGKKTGKLATFANAKSGAKRPASGTGAVDAEGNPITKHGIKTPYGYRFYGVTEVEANSDEPSFVWAKAYSGKYRGATFYATQARFNGEHVILQFDKMVYKGDTYDVRAYALDPTTKRTALVDDIDRHPEKWLYFTLAKIGEAFTNVATTRVTVNAPTGSVQTVEGGLTDSDRIRNATIAGTLGAYSPSAEDYLQVKNTVLVYNGREVIFFLAQDLEI